MTTLSTPALGLVFVTGGSLALAYYLLAQKEEKQIHENYQSMLCKTLRKLRYTSAVIEKNLEKINNESEGIKKTNDKSKVTLEEEESLETVYNHLKGKLEELKMVCKDLPINC